MDEILNEERRELLIAKFTEVAKDDVLTNGDALKIIDILRDACERKKAEIYEDMVIESMEGGEGE